MPLTEQPSLPSITKFQNTLDRQLKQVIVKYQDILSLSPSLWQKLPQWISVIQNQKRPLIIAISGASGSGKSFLREQLLLNLTGQTFAQAFTQDNYYIDFESHFFSYDLNAFYNEINLDDPQYIRFETLAKDLEALKSTPIGGSVHIPKFRFGTPNRLPGITQEYIELTVPPILITEGIHAFYDPTVTNHYDLKIFVDVDEPIRKERWIQRNIKDNRGTTENMWQTTVECLETHILPARAQADIIVNNSNDRASLQIVLNEVLFIFQRQAESERINGNVNAAVGPSH